MASAVGTSQVSSIAARFARVELGIPVLLLALLAMMILPVPAFLLDLLFTFNIALSLVVLLVAVYTRKPLDFGVFPTILLINGHEGGDAAGAVIEAFGNVVIGGNYVVGIVVFVILVIINFVVVTKGAGRVSEVSARFTLDAMPGKQMAIDADMNAGVIDQETARRRRQEVSDEADFYGAMDGASKFVRGDAVAGILILLINIVGGLGIGMLQHHLPFGIALENYTLLTIGDGLVAQIPSLLLSTAAAIIVTRVSDEQELGSEVLLQMGDPRALGVSAAVLAALGVIPGMPHLVFLGLAALTGWGAWWQLRQGSAATPGGAAVAIAGGGSTPAALPAPVTAPAEREEVSWDDVKPVDVVGLEVGYRLIPMVDRSQGGELLARIKGVRRKLSADLGFLVPTVHIRDNLELAPNSYRITLTGVTAAESDLHPERWLAINPGEVFGRIDGIETRDPAFGLEAVWITESQKEAAQARGYTVVDASTVVATHLDHVLKGHAAELLGHDEAQQLLGLLQKVAPRLAEALVPDSVPLGTLLRVLQNLLREHVPIRDLRTIAEALIEGAAISKRIEDLTAAVRIALGRLIAQTIWGNASALDVITLDPKLELLLQRATQQGGVAAIEPTLAERLQRGVRQLAERAEAAGRPAVLLTAPELRATLAEFLRGGHTVHVLSYREIPDGRQITISATVGGE